MMAEELTRTILVHLNGANVLALFYIDVRNVEPDVREVGRGLAHLRKNVARLVEIPFVRQHCA
jgi:hypothetical protein